jgi:hypothetical protein
MKCKETEEKEANYTINRRKIDYSLHVHVVRRSENNDARGCSPMDCDGPSHKNYLIYSCHLEGICIWYYGVRIRHGKVHRVWPTYSNTVAPANACITS